MFLQPMSRWGGAFVIIMGIVFVLGRPDRGDSRVEHWQYVTAGVMWITVGLFAIIYKPKQP